jgi:hypothetical protein
VTNATHVFSSLGTPNKDGLVITSCCKQFAVGGERCGSQIFLIWGGKEPNRLAVAHIQDGYSAECVNCSQLPIRGECNSLNAHSAIG